jgi:hypothetical protein
MPILSMSVDVDGPLKAFADLRQNQLPFTIARALTMTAQDSQAAMRELEGKVFRLRNDWLVQNTRIKAATTTNLVAQVYEDTRNRSGSAPDYLSDQETGGLRVGFVRWNGNVYRAVPTKYLNPFGGVIPRELAAQNLLGAVNGKYTITVMKRVGDFKYQRNAVRRQNRVQTMAFFVVKLKDGTLALCGRNAGSQEAIPLYILVAGAHVSGIFPAFDTVSEVATAKFPENLTKAATETIANDLLRGSGIRIKL